MTGNSGNVGFVCEAAEWSADGANFWVAKGPGDGGRGGGREAVRIRHASIVETLLLSGSFLVCRGRSRHKSIPTGLGQSDGRLGPRSLRYVSSVSASGDVLFGFTGKCSLRGFPLVLGFRHHSYNSVCQASSKEPTVISLPYHVWCFVCGSLLTSRVAQGPTRTGRPRQLTVT